MFSLTNGIMLKVVICMLSFEGGKITLQSEGELILAERDF